MESININRSNYEIYLIDYLDGTLAPGQEEQLLAFLDENPDIQNEIEGLEFVRIEPEHDPFAYKMDLKKNVPETGRITQENFEEYCIAYYEGDLSTEEQIHVQNFVQEYPASKAVFAAYARTRLNADRAELFPQKTLLYQNAVEAGESVNDENYQDFLIAALEHDLDKEQEAELHKFIDKNEQYKKEVAVFSALRLQADGGIHYPDKSALKRRSIAMPAISRRLAGMAAAILILISFYFLFERPTATPYKTTAIARHTIDGTLHLRSMANNQEKEQTGDISTTLPQVVRSKHHPLPETTKPEINTRHSIDEIAQVKTHSVASLSIMPEAMEIETSVLNYTDYLQTKTAKEDGIVLNGLAARFVNRFSNLLSKSDRLKKDRLRGQMKNIAEVAMNGYNILVESERNPRRKGEDFVNP
jgi:hypothetical protein